MDKSGAAIAAPGPARMITTPFQNTEGHPVSKVAQALYHGFL